MKTNTLKKIGLPALGILAAMSANSAMAEVSPVTMSSETSTKSLLNVLKENTTLVYSGVYHGPSLSRINGKTTPNPDGSDGGPQDLENVITAGYKLNKKNTVGANAHFFYNFTNALNGNGQDITMKDPAIFFTRSGMIERGNLKVAGQFFLTPAVTKNDLRAGSPIAAALSPVAIVTYDVPKTRLTTGLYNKVGVYIPQLGAASDAAITRFKLVAAPFANYQITDKVAATMWVDLIGLRHRVNTGNDDFFNDNDQIGIQPGVNWDITPSISVAPFLNILPSRPWLSATSFAASFTGKLF